MGSLVFLEDSPRGNITVGTRRPNGELFEIPGIDIGIVRNHSRVLADRMNNSDRYIYIADASSDAVAALFRYIYLGDYTICEELCDGPVSLLLQLQLYLLADRFEMNLLQNQVESRLWSNVENASDLSSKKKNGAQRTRNYQILGIPDATGPLPELCEGLQLLYKDTTLRKLSQFRVLIAKYCVATFDAYGYGDSNDFIQTVFQCPLLHADLVKANFEAEAMVQGIINLQTCADPLHQKQSEPWSDNKLDFTCWNDPPHSAPLTRHALETHNHLSLPIRPALDCTSRYIPRQPSLSSPSTNQSPVERNEKDIRELANVKRDKPPKSTLAGRAPHDVHPAFRTPHPPPPSYGEAENGPTDYLRVQNRPDHILAPQPSAAPSSRGRNPNQRTGLPSEPPRDDPRRNFSDYRTGANYQPVPLPWARNNPFAHANQSVAANTPSSQLPASRGHRLSPTSQAPAASSSNRPPSPWVQYPARPAMRADMKRTQAPPPPKAPASDEEWFDIQSAEKSEPNVGKTAVNQQDEAENPTVVIGQNVRFGDAVVIGRQDAEVAPENETKLQVAAKDGKNTTETKAKDEPDTDDEWEVLEIPKVEVL